MRINILFALFLIGFFSSNAFGQNEVSIDNQNIQQYKGRLGRWVMAETDLSRALQLSGTAEDDVAALNQGIPQKGYVFVLFSEKYIQNKGLARKTIESKEEDFIWPIDGGGRIDISSQFGERNNRHEGIDIPIAKGTLIVASQDGRVVRCAFDGGHGNSILIAHRNNFYTRYSHNSEILVKTGDEVKKGQIIAFSGSTGNSTGPHLHFEIRFNDIPLNPLDFLPTDDNIVIIKNKKKHHR